MRIFTVIILAFIVGKIETAQGQWIPSGSNTYTTGNVSIGTSAISGTKLNVVTSGNPGIEVTGNSSSAQTPDISISRSSATSEPAKAASLQLSDPSTASYNLIQSSSAGLQFFNFYNNEGWWTERMRLTGNGNLGIGTTTPLDKLHINGNLSIRPDDAATPSYLNFKRTTDGWIAARMGQAYGQNYGAHLIFETNAGSTGTDVVERMRISQSGDVGIGTMAPLSKLHINGGVVMTSDASHNNINAKLDGSFIPALRFTRWTGAANINQNAFVGQYFNETTQAYELGLGTASSATGDQNANSMIMILNLNGNVGIGTTTPGSFKLAVEGKIGAREVNVTTTNPWPDYVFENNYNLPALAELEAYIKINKHLPEVPTACAVEDNGVNLGEMNSVLLKKVEELTLYMIEQNKIAQEQSKQLQQLKKENEKQQIEIEALKRSINKKTKR